MKTWKRLFALLLTLLLLGGVSVSAFAAEHSEDSLALYQGVESIRMIYESDINLYMSIMEDTLDMDMGFEGNIDFFLDPEQGRMTLNATIADTEEESIIYYEKSEDGYRMVVSNDDGETWSEQLVDAADLPSGASVSVEFLAKLTDLAQILPETGDGEVKGTPVTIYSGLLTGEDASGIISASGALAVLESGMGMDTGEMDVSDLGSLPVTIALDRKTGRLMRYDLDITEIEQNMMDQLIENLLRSELGGEDLPEDLDLNELFTIKVNKAVTSTILYDYNKVEEFILPEVTAAPERDEEA